MSFLHPAFLWGIGFAALPILLLFMNRKRLVLPWAAYEWMRNAIVQQKKKIHIDDLLKLISKILLIIAIVLMIARPFVRIKGVKGNTLIIADISPSMTVRYNEGTRLDKVKKMLKPFVDKCESKIALYSFGNALEPVVAKYTNDKNALKRGINSLNPGSVYSGAATLFKELRGLPILKKTRRIYVISDFQSCWFGNGLKIADYMKKLGREYPLVWQQVDARADIPNCAVEKIEITPEGLFLGRECFIRVHILNCSDRRTNDRMVTVYADGKRRARLAVRLKPNEHRKIPFSIMFKKEGWHNVTAGIDADSYESDNVQYCAVNVPARLKVLSVVPAHDNNLFPVDGYIKAALQSLMPNQLVYESISSIELPAKSLADVDILITVKIPLSTGSLYAEKIQEFVRRGNGLVAFLPAENNNEAGMFGIDAVVSKNPGCVNKQALKKTYLAFMNARGMQPENIKFGESLIFQNVKKMISALLLIKA